MKIDSKFALTVSIAIAASLTTTMTQVRAEGDNTPAMSNSSMKNVNINTSLTRTKLKAMSADSVLKMNKEGKIKLTASELSEVNSIVAKAKKPGMNLANKQYSTVMCPW